MTLSSEPQPDALNGPVYWALVGLGLAGLALCVLHPEWRELQHLRGAEARHAAQLDELRDSLQRQEHELQALQSDPAAIARYARRDLNYRSPTDRFVSVLEFSDRDFVEIGLPDGVGPEISHPVGELPYLPRLNYDAVLADRESRGTLAALSIALLTVAAAFFWRRT